MDTALKPRKEKKMAVSKAELNAWIQEWDSIIDQALVKVRNGEKDVGEFVEDAVRQSDQLPEIAVDALGAAVRAVLRLGKGSLAKGFELAREAGTLGLRLRALFS